MSEKIPWKCTKCDKVWHVGDKERSCVCLDATCRGFMIRLFEEQPPSATIDKVAPDAMSVQVGGSHYKGDKIQHFTIAMENNIPWGEASAMKYIMRHRKKNGVQDLDKAIHYLLMTRQHCYPDAPRDELRKLLG